MNRASRRIFAAIAALALAFAQLAVSAYACPQQAREAAAQAKVVAAPAGVTEHCAKQGKKNLCERHCAYGDSSLQSAPPAATAPDLTPLPWRIELIAAPAPGNRACRTFITAWAEPPPLARFPVLRI